MHGVIHGLARTTLERLQRHLRSTETFVVSCEGTFTWTLTGGGCWGTMTSSDGECGAVSCATVALVCPYVRCVSWFAAAAIVDISTDSRYQLGHWPSFTDSQSAWRWNTSIDNIYNRGIAVHVHPIPRFQYAVWEQDYILLSQRVMIWPVQSTCIHNQPEKAYETRWEMIVCSLVPDPSCVWILILTPPTRKGLGTKLGWELVWVKVY